MRHYIIGDYVITTDSDGNDNFCEILECLKDNKYMVKSLETDEEFFVGEEAIKPIPITEDILVLNHFGEYGDEFFLLYKHISIEKEKDNKEYENYWNISVYDEGILSIQYLHLLQHFIFLGETPNPSHPLRVCKKDENGRLIVYK